MNYKREMLGLADFTGRTVGTLTVGGMMDRHPEPRYSTVCKCGARSSATQTQIRNGTCRCKSSMCEKTQTRDRRVERSAHEDATALANRLAREARVAQEQASAARMEAETQDHTILPSRPKPRLSDAPMRERDRITLREHRAEAEAAERAERERREAPIRKATSVFQETVNKLALLERDKVANGIDPEFVIDPETIGDENAVSEGEIDAWQREQSAEFTRKNPDYHRCPENFEAITGYLNRNAPDLVLVSARQFGEAFKRLRSFGLMKEKPAQVRQPAPPPARPKGETGSVQPKLIDGWDPVTKEPRKWTEQQLDRLSADDYRRALRIYKADLELPNVGPGAGISR